MPTVSVSDRFGDYGLTGAMIFRRRGDALVVDTFLLSCRALGRGVEHRMVAQLGEIARERGLARVEIPFVAGQRNRPAALFLESIGAEADAVPAAAAGGGRAVPMPGGRRAGDIAPRRRPEDARADRLPPRAHRLPAHRHRTARPRGRAASAIRAASRSAAPAG